ncbi:hypothetical protein D3C87_1728830 [compost metagenome]
MSFTPSEVLDKPHAMVAINVFAADTDEEARRLSTSQQIQFLRLIRGGGGPLEPPVESMEELWPGERERMVVESQQRYSVIGSKETVRSRMRHLQELTGADEWIASGQIYDHQARLRSYEILSQVVREGY